MSRQGGTGCWSVRAGLAVGIAITSILPGCYTNAHPVTYGVTGPCQHVTTLWMDPQFTIREIRAINDAADAWSRATPECWRPTYTYNDADIRIVFAESESDILDDHPGNTVGLWAPTPRRIWVTRQDRTITEIRTISAHEFGHYLGLQHNDLVPHGTSLMDPFIQNDYPMGPASNVPVGDVRAYWAIR